MEDFDSNILLTNRYYPVLQKIFEYLPVKDFYTVRLVCSTWKDAARPILMQRKKCVIELNLDEDSSFEVIQKITSIFKSEKEYPFTRYEFVTKTLGNVSLLRKYQKIVSDFFMVCSPYIRHLTIDVLSIKAMELNKAGCFNFRTLEKLEISLPDEENKVLYSSGAKKVALKRITDCFKSIMKNAPNMRSLSLLEVEKDDDQNIRVDYICSLLKEINGMQHLFSGLKYLEVELNNESQITALAKAVKKLKLEKLSLCLDLKVQCPCDKLKDILHSQSSSLKSLLLYFATEDLFDHGRISFPRMQALESILIGYLNGYEQEDDPEQFETVKYREKFPALKSLEFWTGDDIEDDNWSWTNVFKRFFSMSSLPLNTVHQLVLPECCNVDLAKVLPEVCYLFPNLKKLIVTTDWYLEKIICGIRNLRNLEELEVCFCYKEECHQCNACPPCAVAAKALARFPEQEEELESVEEARRMFHLLQWQLRKLKLLQNLNTVRFNCLNAENNLQNVELIIRKNNCGDYTGIIQVDQREYEGERYWMAL